MEKWEWERLHLSRDSSGRLELRRQSLPLTFSILNIYEGQVPVYHFDLYRIEDEQEIFEAGLYEYIGTDGISIIEWPQMMEEYPTVRLIDVTMEKDLDRGEDFRVITVKGIDEF